MHMNLFHNNTLLDDFMMSTQQKALINQHLLLDIMKKIG